jgi:DNA primase
MTAATDLNHTFDLLSLAEHDTTLRRAGAGWWAGPCPFCGGTDRFTLKQTALGFRWYCRHCGGDRYHTALDYIMQRQACSFPEALAWATGSSPAPPGLEAFAGPSPATALPAPHGIEALAGFSPDAWQTRALAYMEACETTIFSDLGASARAWLHARGLKEQTLRRYHIGYNPKDTFEPSPDWGLPQPDDGARHAVWLPRGIVIPCYENDQLYYLKTRRPAPVPAKC